MSSGCFLDLPIKPKHKGTNMRKYLLPVAAAVAALSSAAAFAAQTSDTFQTRIAIQTSCSILVGDVDFGNVGVINGTETASGTVDVNCSAGTGWTVSFDSVLPQTTLSSTMTNVNGEDVAYNASLTSGGGSGPASFAINASLPAQVTPTPGVTYTDNRTLYLNY